FDGQYKRRHTERNHYFVHFVERRDRTELRGHDQPAECDHGHHDVDDVERWLRPHLHPRHVIHRAAHLLLERGGFLVPPGRHPALRRFHDEQRGKEDY